MTKDGADLTTPLIATTFRRRLREFLLLPGLIPASLMATTTSMVMFVVVTGLTSVVGKMSRNRSRGDLSRSRLDLGLLVDELFMDLRERGRSVATLDLINQCLVIIWKASKDAFNFVLVVHRLSEKCDLIESRRESLKILVDGHGSFGPVL